MIDKTKLTITLALVLVGALVVYGSLKSALNPTSSGIQQQDSAAFSNPVTYTLVKADGTVIKGEVIMNAVTAIGRNFTRDSIAGIANITRGMRCLELSTDSGAPTGTETACPSPVTTNNMTINCTATTVTPVAPAGNYSVSFTWVATGTVSGIAKVCLSNSTTSPSTNSLFALALLSPTVTVGAGDQLTVNYFVGLT